MSLGLFALVSGATTVGCGGDDGDPDAARPTGPPTEASVADSDAPRADDGDASAELTLAGETYRYEPYLGGCQSIGDTTTFVGHGAAPGRQLAELTVSYAADPPGSDVPGGEWTLTARQPDDTPGLATGDELYAARPGLLRTASDGFVVESDGSTISISGPAEDASTGSDAESDLALECG